MRRRRKSKRAMRRALRASIGVAASYAMRIRKAGSYGAYLKRFAPHFDAATFPATRHYILQLAKIVHHLYYNVMATPIFCGTAYVAMRVARLKVAKVVAAAR